MLEQMIRRMVVEHLEKEMKITEPLREFGKNKSSPLSSLPLIGWLQE